MRTEILFIGRCRSCERTLKSMGEARPIVATRVSRWRERYEQNERSVHGFEVTAYKCRWYEEEGAERPTLNYGSAPCLKCDARICVQPINGTLKLGISCGSKCTGASGPNCDCSCAGLNHGAAHA